MSQNNELSGKGYLALFLNSISISRFVEEVDSQAAETILVTLLGIVSS